MKAHKHIGIVKAADELTLKEALTLAAVQHEVLAYLAPNIAVLERETARKLADALREQDMHPKVIN